MKKADQSSEINQEKVVVKNHYQHGGGSGAVYGLGLIGALFYFLQSATTFSAIVIGVVKSFVWPALLVFKLLTYLQL